MVITPVIHGKFKDLIYIKIRIHDGGATPKFKSTGNKIKPKDWNKKGNAHKKNWVKTSHPNHKQLNDKIAQMLTQIEQEKLGVSEIEILKLKSNKKKFLNYFDETNDLVRNVNTRDTNQQSIKPLKRFLTENDMLWLSFGDINKKLINKYYNWLLDMYANSSANQYLGVFRTFYNKAYEDEDLKLKKPDNHPFENFKYAKNKTQNKFLSNEDLTKLINFEAINRKYEIAKNMWLFQFVQACRVSDVLFLKWYQINYRDGEFYLDLFTSKTHDRVSRKLPLDVIELFITGFERYYPNITNELNLIEEKIGGLITHINEIKQLTPKELTQADFIRFISQGKSPEFVQEKINKIEKGKRIILHASEQLEGFLIEKKYIFRDYLKLIHKNHPTNYIWDKPQKENFMVDNNSDENKAKYNRCTSQNYEMLQHIKKRLGIATQLSSHTARHTASQNMLNSGIQFNQMSQYLSHSNHMTTELYVSRMGVRNDEITDLLSGFIKR